METKICKYCNKEKDINEFCKNYRKNTYTKDVSRFDESESIKVVNSLENLRPMWSTTREINGIIYEGNLNKKKYYKNYSKQNTKTNNEK